MTDTKIEKIWPLQSCGGCPSCCVIPLGREDHKWHCYMYNLDITDNSIIHSECKLEGREVKP
jgi:hypothetical protein